MRFPSIYGCFLNHKMIISVSFDHFAEIKIKMSVFHLNRIIALAIVYIDRIKFLTEINIKIMKVW